MVERSPRNPAGTDHTETGNRQFRPWANGTVRELHLLFQPIPECVLRVVGFGERGHPEIEGSALDRIGQDVRQFGGCRVENVGAAARDVRTSGPTSSDLSGLQDQEPGAQGLVANQT